MTVPRKQRAETADWEAALVAAQANPDPTRAEALVETAARRTRDVTDGYVAAYSWSGGKDSQVAALVARTAGLTSGVCVLTRGLEYPAFASWIDDYRPAGCEIETRPHDLRWLSQHPCWLFPETASSAARWFASVQHTGQRAYARRRHLDVLVMGRRLADGNQCGPDGLYRDPRGFLRLSPLYDWTHEDILCVLVAYDLPLAPCYDWPDGWRVATGPWPKRRRRGTLADTWARVLDIDPTVVEAAARYRIQGAASALTA